MTIIAVAGRRIDAADAPVARFPLERVNAVYDEFRDLLRERGATAVVASGACGADLVALQAALNEDIPRRMVLPFAHKRFRTLSVIDRPGNWDVLFDVIYGSTQSSLGIKTLPATGDMGRDFARTNGYIIREAQRIAKERNERDILAVVMWEGSPRGPDDMTADFAARAASLGFPVQTIITKA